MLQLGKLVSPNDALAIGMVDKVVPLSGLHDASHEMLAQLLQVFCNALVACTVLRVVNAFSSSTRFL